MKKCDNEEISTEAEPVEAELATKKMIQWFNGVMIQLFNYSMR